MCPFFCVTTKVAPLAGARIEIDKESEDKNAKLVAPLAGARIEIDPGGSNPGGGDVAPLAGARIEIVKIFAIVNIVLCRSPRGSAD